MKIKAIIVTVFCCFLFLQCSIRCNGGDENRGIIKASVFQCLPFTGSDNVVITSDSAYHQLVDSSCGAAPIDFNEFSLLGFKTDASGCDRKTIREVNAHEEDKRYHYKITVKECGICKPLVMSMNWVLVPRLPAGWRVTFERK